MTLVGILLGIALLLCCLLLLRCDLHLIYQTNFSVRLGLLGLRFPLYPKKKKRVNIRKYSRRALAKQRKKAAKKARKRPEKAKKTQSDAPPADKPNDLLSFLKTILENIFRKTFGYLRVRTDRIVVRVGSPDPAVTALLFGAVNTAALCLLETLDQFGRWDKTRRAHLEIAPDFLATKTDVDIHVVLSLRVWHLLAILTKTFLDYLKQPKNDTKA